MQGLGLSPAAAADAVNVPFNDLARLEAALEAGDVALVIAEPALTNCSLVLPEPGFLAGACRLARDHGALTCLDETHTWQLAYGGFVRAEDLSPDFVSLGKGLGSGTPLGAYGMSAPVSAFVEEHHEAADSPVRGLALGGTTFASALSMAAARAMLEDVATEEGYRRIARLGTRLADGIDAIIRSHGLDWCAFRYGPRSGFCQTPQHPKTYAEAHHSWTFHSVTPCASTWRTGACGRRSTRPDRRSPSRIRRPTSTVIWTWPDPSLRNSTPEVAQASRASAFCSAGQDRPQSSP
ncbi:MAG: aminotransferase class III-fold pyridoxal phosphate-dependent enzyme, partial [Hyphomicrobiales bacterium]